MPCQATSTQMLVVVITMSPFAFFPLLHFKWHFKEDFRVDFGPTTRRWVPSLLMETTLEIRAFTPKFDYGSWLAWYLFHVQLDEHNSVGQEHLMCPTPLKVGVSKVGIGPTGGSITRRIGIELSVGPIPIRLVRLGRFSRETEGATSSFSPVEPKEKMEAAGF
ncbi:hypothetical protein AMTR_s00057p00086840 [Amborella trichopoda]|uniref:Uncharacterized protein n=1 Tax=Amborella trichopoda TaxID=13333 RepID=U5D3H4_AMBTC|nr:hypothetical protein AMTR_s00057p00086840 [Amborella trichopoda]